MNSFFKNIFFVIVSVSSVSILPADNGMHDDQFAKETASKLARAAQQEQEELKTQEDDTENEANSDARSDSEEEFEHDDVLKKTAYREKELQDACEILF